MEIIIASIIGLSTLHASGGNPQALPQGFDCETVQVEGTNYLNFVDASCANGSTGSTSVQPTVPSDNPALGNY